MSCYIYRKKEFIYFNHLFKSNFLSIRFTARICFSRSRKTHSIRSKIMTLTASKSEKNDEKNELQLTKIFKGKMIHTIGLFHENHEDTYALRIIVYFINQSIYFYLFTNQFFIIYYFLKQIFARVRLILFFFKRSNQSPHSYNCLLSLLFIELVTCHENFKLNAPRIVMGP